MHMRRCINNDNHVIWRAFKNKVPSLQTPVTKREQSYKIYNGIDICFIIKILNLHRYLIRIIMEVAQQLK